MNKRIFLYATLFLLSFYSVGVFAMSMKDAVQQIGQHANMMPLERGITLPMVKVENNSILVRRLIYFTRLSPEEGTTITPPQYIASYDYSNGSFINLKKFEIDVPNLQPPPWIHNRPGFEKAEDIIPEFNRIWSLYDVLIPEYVKGTSRCSDEIRQLAKEYIHYFNRHAEKPLLPYYEMFSGDFIRWVERAAGL
ncbi:MAG: hypothetical protein LC541_17450 [Candidatus Thiodiazotropha sp.]|nr:hypothetical protein [Candidatus Thiodiazotropha sp.]MCM8885056.1 hypothetical protein [Candidatus Thiodiazotropha sp.]MCM8920894.1 hypothetical protein [Candidatus Thiodiazotropha sp.]MCU7863776.1 hypothetical protein [Candidatus Thiodiazotropha sp. (ex Lucinoma borealis)]MCU7886255.1 hypothetical protein [Candidatus Thiodiazotropha sp. (ex Lucinoma annulata)]